jgi:peptidoglycan/xylan/chitin deacetylase (PgdA/CDA1 family)
MADLSSLVELQKKSVVNKMIKNCTSSYGKKMIPIMIFLASVSVFPSYAMSSCQCVAFRLDDVQNYWIDNPQLSILKLFHEKNASLTIGIIGGSFGDDPKLVNFIKNNIHNKNSEIEIANHGWLHENFTHFNKHDQIQLMFKTNTKINRIFGVTPTIFIPPYEKFNNNTIVAMKENHLKFLSSNVDDDSNSYLVENHGITHIPGTAQTGTLTNHDTVWLHKGHTHTFVKIMQGIRNYGYASVVIHPQEYSLRNGLDYYNEVDKSQIKELAYLIDEVKKSGLKIVLLGKIPSLMNETSTSPQWLDNIFTYYEDGKITDKDIYADIKYLLEKKLIQL